MNCQNHFCGQNIFTEAGIGRSTIICKIVFSFACQLDIFGYILEMSTVFKYNVKVKSKPPVIVFVTLNFKDRF